MGSGIVIYITEFWRDWEGRGDLFHGVIDGPQAISIFLVIAGAVILRARASLTIAIDAQHEVHVPTEATHD
jgi:hypothetical protein